MVRSRVERESEWSRDQVALMVAWEELESDLGPHGYRMSEVTSPLVNAPGSNLGFKARKEPIIDEVARLEERARREYREKHKDDEGAMDGAIFLVDRFGD